MPDEDLSRLLSIFSSSDYHMMVILLGFLSLAAAQTLSSLYITAWRESQRGWIRGPSRDYISVSPALERGNRTLIWSWRHRQSILPQYPDERGQADQFVSRRLIGTSKEKGVRENIAAMVFGKYHLGERLRLTWRQNSVGRMYQRHTFGTKWFAV
ncbi:hypothetical protein ARMGADRAFT_1040179 [Armillaria gallica]|uniref:Uncharacterized protein n=1 Tax=Armillaria gallica TaxID=47427 RepID=A0A2H3CM66_ARMGA|nr:hypothetical protein ARMGADRAFT_1040179 [Armillaria gallica]